MNLLNLWREKLAAGKIRYDADLLVIQNASLDGDYGWGTVFYSQAREDYKTRIKQTERRTTFDPDLMSQLQIGEFGGLVIAANPHSLFEGHLVIYPKIKSPALRFEDVYDLTRLAQIHGEQTFIFNMERSAASILDWAHYQAYPVDFPIARAQFEVLDEFDERMIARSGDDFPAYALLAENFDAELISRWIIKVLELLNGDNPHGQRIPCNFIWRKNRVWIVPRGFRQSNIAASYFGGLEMGGIFCLPNADNFRDYLPDPLKKEIMKATLYAEKETREWFEKNARQILCEMIETN